MSKIIVNTEVMGPDFSELVLHELNYEWSREVVTLAASEADLPFGMVLMREAGEYKPLTESRSRAPRSLAAHPSRCSSALSKPASPHNPASSSGAGPS
ncbi:MAG: hypothetical protein ACLU6O_03315 [Bilophila wadsworthia]